MVSAWLWVLPFCNSGVVVVKKKYRVIKTVTTVDGTLYKEELVTFENKEEDGDWRVKDNMGRIWYVDPKNLTDSPVSLSRGS